ncbi:MAG: hypothetical protein HYU33_07570, partial [Candidatus Omnitrophica bacterium]|nr:hypothetical protein [Candidatus Omnitrophota bacterium]
MAFLPKTQWKQWAQEWNLTHSPQRGWVSRNEWVAGSYRGFLLKVGCMGEQGVLPYILIRFPKQQDASALRERLLREPGLASMLPKGQRKRGQALEVSESSIVWKDLSMRWALPKVAVFRDWVERLTQALSQTVSPFSGQCENCRTSRVDSFVLFEGVPVYLCGGCQEKYTTEANVAEHSYQNIEANYFFGTVFAAAAAIIGAIGWAALAILTGRVFALVAIGIAFLVALSYLKGAKKVDMLGRILAVLLTLGGVVLGEVLFYAQAVHKANPQLP